MKRCNKCILQDSSQNIIIGDDGICNACTTYQQRNQKEYESNLQMMENLFENARETAWPYHVLVAFSGGKDSSYLLYFLKNKYNLNVLAFSLIHPFLRKNVENVMEDVAKNIGVDFIKFYPQEKIIKTIIRKGMTNPELYGLRESFGCSLCGAFHYLIPFVFAAKMGIPVVATGADPAQAVIYPSLEQQNRNPMMIPYIPEPLLLDAFGNELKNSIYHINKNDIFALKSLPKLIAPLSIIDYDFRENAEKLEEIGIIEQKKTHSLLSNCTIHHFFAFISYKKFNCHPYEHNFSDALRIGYPTFIEQFAGEHFISQNPREETIRFLDEYKVVLFLIAESRDMIIEDLFSVIGEKCPFMMGLLGRDLMLQALKDIMLIHDWAKYFDVDLNQV